MAPSKMSRSKRRRFPNQKLKEESPERRQGRPCAKYKRKRKLSDMLGYQWSKEELLQFYKAYCKYGKDFKKVAGVIPNRSQDMVEALYNMHKAYLSLPVRATSAAGLISMMIDRHMTTDGSCSVQGTNGSLAMFYKRRKRGQTHIKSRSQRLDRMVPDIFQHKKTPEIQLHAVGKRTPRFPVRYSFGEECRNSLTSKTDLDAIAINANQVAALALEEASLKDRSLQVTFSPIKILGHIRASPIHNDQRKVIGAAMDEEDYDFGIGERENENGVFATHKEGIRPAEILHEQKEFNLKQQNVCSLREMNKISHGSTGFDLPKVKVEAEAEDTNGKMWVCPAGPSKRRQKISEDESTALDALLALASIAKSNSLQYPTFGSEFCLQVQKEIGNTYADGKPIMSGVVSTDSKKKKSINESNSGVNSIPVQKAEGEALLLRDKSMCKLKNHDFQITEKPWKKKRKPIAAKIPESECDSRSLLAESQGTQTEACSMKHVEVLVKQISRRKMHLKKALLQKEVRSGVDVGTKPPEENSYSDLRGAIDLKRMLSHCLSSPLLRKWCFFEWFYGAIDAPWFFKNEFVEYLNHAELGGLPTRLTRAEWSLIRSALGKPRRLSERFLQEERKKLHDYRENIRETYAGIGAGIWHELVVDPARPLLVGQRVVAWHPMIKELHDGNVLAVDCNRCKVQFDQPDLGVELIMDVDCMCLSPPYIFPRPLRTLNFSTHTWSENARGSKLEINCKDRKMEDWKDFSFCESLVKNYVPLNFDSTSYLVSSVVKETEEAAVASAGKPNPTVGEVVAEETYGSFHSLGKVQAGSVGTIPFCDLSCSLEKQKSGCLRQDIGSHLIGIFSSSIQKARKMVSEEVMSSLNEGKLSSIGEIYVSKDVQVRNDDSSFLDMRCSGPAPDNYPWPPADYDQATSAESEIGVPDAKDLVSSNQNELHFPTELISTCVATLLVMQACSDHKYPPGEVAQILHYAVKSLSHCCSDNIPVYRDIEQCMGIIKSQVLALVPTHSS